jgi:aconitate hydratase
MGILPLQFSEGANRRSLGLTGGESFTIRGLVGGLRPRQEFVVEAAGDGGDVKRFKAVARVDNATEVEYLRHGGILNMVLRQLMAV